MNQQYTVYMHETNIQKRHRVYIHKISSVGNGTVERESLVTTFMFSSPMIISMKNSDHGRYRLILGCHSIKNQKHIVSKCKQSTFFCKSSLTATL